jgi:hypothetical protein
MPTNSIGPGKVPFSCPLPIDTKRALGRKAFDLDLSSSELVRQLIRKYLAGEITLTLALMLFAWCGLQPPSPDLRSQSLQTAVRRVRRGGRRNETIDAIFAAIAAEETAAA